MSHTPFDSPRAQNPSDAQPRPWILAQGPQKSEILGWCLQLNICYNKFIILISFYQRFQSTLIYIIFTSPSHSHYIYYISAGILPVNNNLISILYNLKLNRDITAQATEEMVEESKGPKKIKPEVLLSRFRSKEDLYRNLT